MTTESRQALTFHLTGKRPDGDKNDPASLGLCPALLRSYLDLDQIRHGYPMVLVDTEGEPPIESLSEVVNRILRSIAPPGIDGERTRRNVLTLENHVRVLASRRDLASLSSAFDEAASELLSGSELSEEEHEQLLKNLIKARGELGIDGRLVNCDEKASLRVLEHVFNRIQRENSRKASRQIEETLHRLRDIVRADDMRSKAARTPEALRNAVGSSFEDDFDFTVMSKSLPETKPETLLPSGRRHRIESALAVLESQRVFSSESDDDACAVEFARCTEALHFHEARLPAMIELAKATRVAELEIENAYSEEVHDAFFADFDQSSLDPGDASAFPAYLVCMNEEHYDAAEKAALVGILSSQLPIKVLFHTTEVFRSPSVGDEGDFAAWNLGLARMALGLGSAFVMQTTASNLHPMRRSICDGMSCPGPALFSIALGGDAERSPASAYLLSASAMQSRAFPTFVYNPSDGDDWAARFRLDANPKPESTWPVSELVYQDADLQRVSEEIPFTLVDHLAADRRYAGCFMSVPNIAWGPSMIPLREYVRSGDSVSQGKVPYILMVDEDDVLHRVVVQRGLIEAAERSAQEWHNLQELAGIENSHVRRLVEREKQAWEEQQKKEVGARKGRLGRGEASVVVATNPIAGEPETQTTAGAVEKEARPEVPYIETARCSTCDECVNRNSKMFRYDENKQAYIADVHAGTYRQMVESAEACKLAIIHPGKPWNPDEPDLEDLVSRGAAFG